MFRSPDDTCSNLAPQKTVAVALAPEIRSMVAMCGRPSGLPGSSYPRSANPHTATTLRLAANGSSFSPRYEEVLLMLIDKPLHCYAKMSHPATDRPALFIDANTPLRDLNACAAERLNASTPSSNISISLPAPASPITLNTISTRSLTSPESWCRM